MTKLTCRRSLLAAWLCVTAAGCAEDKGSESIDRETFDANAGVPSDASSGTTPRDGSTPAAPGDGGAGAVPGPGRDASGPDARADANEAGTDAGARDAGRDADATQQVLGDGGVLQATIVVKAGQTFDGEGKRFIAGTALGDGSQSETQQPLFKLEDGAKLRNVVLGAPAADGIHCHGDVELENIVWEDIGEDALTIKASGTVVLNGGSARNGDDKVFQINAASTFRLSNFQASDAGKLIRQNGGTKFKVDVFIDACDIANMGEAIFRTDSDSSTVNMTNTRYSNIGEEGDELFLGVAPANVTTSNNTQY
jgi:pectate lyase C